MLSIKSRSHSWLPSVLHGNCHCDIPVVKERMAAIIFHQTFGKSDGHSPRLDGSWMGWIHSVQLRIVLNGNFFLRPLLINRKHTIGVDQMPLRLIIGGRLARDDGMLANLLVRAFACGLVDLVGPVRMTGELLVQRPAGELAPVKAGGLLRFVVTEPTGDHLVAVGGAEIETVGRGLVAQMLLLEFHDLHQGFVHRAYHLVQWVRFLPCVLRAVVGQVGDVQSSGVLGVSAAKDIAVSVEAEQIGHVTTDPGEIRDGAVMHKDMAAEDEGVAVDLRHDTATGRADVGE